MMNFANTLLSRPHYALGFFGLVSAAALGMAFIAQYVYGLAPCELCIWQRWPYGVVIAIAAFSVFILKKHPNAGTSLLALTGLTFLTNAGIAFYHTGVERKWWPSFLEGCSVPEMKGNIADVLARIQTAPIVRCDEIPWTDPVLGWSMANYNVIMCLVLAGLAFYAALRRKQLQA